MPIKFIFSDTETTGTDPNQHGIHQLAGIIGELKGHNRIEELETFNFHVRPFPSDKIVPEALAVSGVTPADLARYADPFKVHEALTAILAKYVDKFNKYDKMIFVGYNAKFDYDFIWNFFKGCGDDYCGSWFWYPPMDVMDRAMWALGEQRSTMKNFKLATVAEKLGVTPDGDLHDALVDIRLTKKIFESFYFGTWTVKDAGARASR